MEIGAINFNLVNFLPRYYRLKRTQRNFFDHAKIRLDSNEKFPKSVVGKVSGYQTLLESYRDKYAGKRCFILGNGPSLSKMNLSPLAHEVTMGSNGIYNLFNEIGFKTTFTFFEDREQTYLRRKDINRLKGTTKMVALTNGYCIKPDKETIFFNERFPCDKAIRPFQSRFSYDFASVAFLGGTVSYVMMQWAFYLGFEEVYVLGIDHNYGPLPEMFPPGKIKITEENHAIIRKLHFNPDYYKIGDVLGVPDVKFQDSSYILANTTFEKEDKKIYNAGMNSKLNAFEHIDFETLF